MEFDAIYYDYRAGLFNRFGIVDNTIRAAFDGYTMLRQYLDENNVDHTPEVIKKHFRACLDRAMDLKEIFETSDINKRNTQDSSPIEIEVSLKKIYGDFAHVPSQHVWVEVKFKFLASHGKQLVQDEIVRVYDAWARIPPKNFGTGKLMHGIQTVLEIEKMFPFEFL